MKALAKKSTTTYAALRAEGVLEIAGVASIVFVRTEQKLHVFHASQIADRALDAYAIQLAVNWLEFGHSSYEVAANLGIDPGHLTRELEAAGYVRLSIQDGGARDGADQRIERGKKQRAAKRRAGRRGRLVRQGAQRFRFERTVAP